MRGLFRTLFVVMACLPHASGCHAAEVVDSVPLAAKLHDFRSARIEVTAPALDTDDASELAEELEKRLKDAKIFADVVHSDQASELFIRVTLMSKNENGSVELRFAIELFDDRRRQLVGRFDLTADSKSDSLPSSGGINIDFDSKTTRALEKAEDAIISHLEKMAGQ